MNLPSIPKSVLVFIDNIIKKSGPGLLLVNWIYTLTNLRYAPDKVPVKFNLKGHILYEANKYILVASCLFGTAGLVDFIHKARSQALAATSSIFSKKQPNLEKIAQSYQMFNAFFLELIIFAWNLLVLNSAKFSNETRALWIKRGIVILALIAIIGYTRYWYILDKYFLSN